ncbi:MAG: hypothetical protein JXA43_02200 [Candidatus Diapherotrites archaeon]|nr:hypothetical protein [Candidatus Diapherotrites archaeon]
MKKLPRSLQDRINRAKVEDENNQKLRRVEDKKERFKQRLISEREEKRRTKSLIKDKD